MKLVEIKNNLVKLSYESEENIILSDFVALVSSAKSYVAQVIDFKINDVAKYVIAKLLFTFSSDGVVDSYDGSAPDINSQITNLNPEELLDLLPCDNPVRLGVLAQKDIQFGIDLSAFQKNLVVFTQNETARERFISNTVRQLFQIKEKSVVIDLNNTFDGYEKIVFTKDFKLPLDSSSIDFLLEYELVDADDNAKAIIQDVFYNVQEYVKTLDNKFLPIDKFVDVVTQQYKQLQIPELALLKNKLLKYKQENIFANNVEEFLSFKNMIEKRNCSIIDLSLIEDALQNEVMYFIRNESEKIDKQIYFFVHLNNNNSNKKLVKSLLNNNHIFTTIITTSGYKYVNELKEYAHNIILFKSNEAFTDYPEFNSFINKMNAEECIVCGESTHYVPFIVSVYDLDLGLTKEDVYGDRQDFVPSKEKSASKVKEVPHIQTPNFEAAELPQASQLPAVENILEEQSDLGEAEDTIEEPDEDDGEEMDIEEDFDDEDIQIDEPQDIASDDLEEDSQDLSDDYEEDNNSLTEEDLDYIDVESSELENHEQTPVVPVYPAEDDDEDEIESDFQQGDIVNHPRYGQGVVEKIIKYGNKVLCSISFDNVGRRLLDPSVSDFSKAEV